MTIDRASVEEGAWLAAEATPGEWYVGQNQREEVCLRRGHWIHAKSVQDAAFIAHWNPEFVAELVRELQRLWRLEEAARSLRATGYSSIGWMGELNAALANPAAHG